MDNQQKILEMMTLLYKDVQVRICEEKRSRSSFFSAIYINKTFRNITFRR